MEPALVLRQTNLKNFKNRLPCETTWFLYFEYNKNKLKCNKK